MCAGSTYCMSIKCQSGHKLSLTSNSMPDTASGHQTCLGKHVGGDRLIIMIIADRTSHRMHCMIMRVNLLYVRNCN